jgi:glycosyltransferase involved in cell wall biosynthesis
MIHVLIATPSHSLFGGVERIIESLARGLPSHGFRVTVGLAKGARWNLPRRFRQQYPGIETIDIDGGSGTRAGRLRGLRQALERSHPDVVLVARLFDAYDAVCERKLRGEPVRLAVTLQAYEAEYIADLASYSAFVDCCVTSGRLIAAAVTRFARPPAGSVVSIPGGVRPASRFVQRDPHAPIRLGYIGRLEQPQKRVLDLVDTLTILRAENVPFTCRIAGTGPAEEDLGRALDERGLKGSVTLEGWKETAELYGDIYPNLDVLLHFAAWEGITIAPREAMAHGAVAVVSRFLGLRSEGHFRDGENSLTFAVGDSAGAADHVARLAQDHGLWSRLSAEARRSEAGSYSEEGALGAWAAAFSEAIGREAACGPQPPYLAFPPSGRLGRWLGEGYADGVRRLLGRYALATRPGDEWPHCSGLADPRVLDQIQEFARLSESELGVTPAARPLTGARG